MKHQRRRRRTSTAAKQTRLPKGAYRLPKGGYVTMSVGSTDAKGRRLRVTAVHCGQPNLDALAKVVLALAAQLALKQQQASDDLDVAA